MAAVTELNWKEHESNTGLYEKLRQVDGTGMATRRM